MTRPDDVLDQWMAQWGPFDQDPAAIVDPLRQREILLELARRLEDNYPFAHPVYAGQMLKPPHAIAAAAYALAQRINPNNHALDGGPATAALERECIRAMCTMVGYAADAALGHLTSSGTIANLEALWVGRQLHPGKRIASSEQAHYTHGRMCGVIGAAHLSIPSTPSGHMDLDALEQALRQGDVGTVVATLGTTSLGAVDDLPRILELARHHGARVHVDAAYGGFFRLLADTGALDAPASQAYLAMGEADSIVIDPHKHGLQPYGCGSVFFRDASVGRFYKHDSPYTYFTSDELHLGEISLECSRAGAAAAALWATLQAFPLTAAGLGRVLARARLAATRAAAAIDEASHLRLLSAPELDIVCFYPAGGSTLAASEVSAWTERIFRAGMHAGPDAFFLAKLNVASSRLAGVRQDATHATVLRSVLMKPEHADTAVPLVERINRAAIDTAPGH